MSQRSTGANQYWNYGPVEERCAGARVRSKYHRLVGFTLVELLVVIGIIGVLVSILLPALSKARRSANTVQCASNLRQILDGMHLYASEYDNFIPGSPCTSGAFLFNNTNLVTGFSNAYSNINCPDISQIWDWQAPIAKVMGMQFNTAGDLASRIQRFHYLNNQGIFTCPENQFIASERNETDANFMQNFGLQSDRMPSYVTAMNFLLTALPESKTLLQSVAPMEDIYYSNYVKAPTGYVPKMTKIGPPSRKIYICDGGLYTYSSNSGAPDPNPTYMLDYSSGFDYLGSPKEGGSYSDYGAFEKYSNALDRTQANSNRVKYDSQGNVMPGTLTKPTAKVDARIFGFRHGITAPFGPDNAYKFNVGFYDGHVETLGDLEGADPSFWCPTGSGMSVTSEMTTDIQNIYAKNSGSYFYCR